MLFIEDIKDLLKSTALRNFFLNLLVDKLRKVLRMNFDEGQRDESSERKKRMERGGNRSRKLMY